MKIKKVALFAIATVIFAGSAAYAALNDVREPVVFFSGHTHDHGETIGAPSHSGGTDKFGCHNGSVPYHCH